MRWPPPRAPILFIITGASGAGKDAVLDRLRQTCPDLHFPITATTRAPRDYEVNGRHYFFLSEAEFLEKRAADYFLETDFHYGHWYGTPRHQVEPALAAGRDVLMRIDIHGAETLRRLRPEAVSIFLAPDRIGDLEMRLDGRESEDAVERARRLAAVPAEMAAIPRFDYLVINPQGDLETAVATVHAILSAERSRTARFDLRRLSFL